jgi:periplasmic protein TonB
MNTFLETAPVKERAMSQLASIAIHAAVIPLLLFGFTNPVVQKTIRHQIELIDPTPLKPFTVTKRTSGGGGGGQRNPLPLTKGQLPKPALKQFVAPQITDRIPLLAMSPSIIAPPDTPLPQSDLNNWGDPLAKLMNGSGGPGPGPGMGNGGPGGGIGSTGGNSYGDSVGVYHAGGSVSAPSVVFQVEPEYSEEARKAKYGGIVMLSVIVDAEGYPRDIRVVKSLGMGLDEKAAEAVRKWKFRAGRKDGKPVNVRAQIQVDFRLL